jgi:hypothetical protein
MCFTSGNSYSKTRSPWNFFETFEKRREGRLRINKNKFTINDKGTGLKPFIIQKESDGNKYLAVTVKHGYNHDPNMRDHSKPANKKPIGKLKNNIERESLRRFWKNFSIEIIN